MDKINFTQKLKNAATGSNLIINRLIQADEDELQINDIFNESDINMKFKISSEECDQIIKCLHKQSNLETLTYSSSYFADNKNTCLQIVQYLEQVTTLRNLTITRINIDVPELLQALIKCLKVNSNVAYLDISFYGSIKKINFSTYIQFCESLTNLEKLTSLSLRLTSDCEIGSETLSSAIRKLVKLESLSITVLRLMTPQCDEIKYLGINLNSLVNLQKLYFSYTSQHAIDLENLISLSNGFKAVHQLKSLDLTLFQIDSDEGLVEVLKGISYLENLQSLSLVLRLKNKNPVTGMVVDLNPYISKLILLEDLTFYVQILGHFHSAYLKQSSGLAQLVNLKKVILQQYSDDPSQVELMDIFDSISHLSKLEEIELIYLRNDIISNESRKVQSLSFHNLVNLSSIYIYIKQCNINSIQMMEFNRAIQSLKSLKTLAFFYDNVDSLSYEYFMDIGKSLQTFINLESLQLKIINCKFCDDSLGEVIKGYLQLPKLKGLDLYISNCLRITPNSTLLVYQSIELLSSLQNLRLTVKHFLQNQQFDIKNYLIPITKNKSLITVKVAIDDSLNRNYFQRKMKKLVNIMMS